MSCHDSCTATEKWPKWEVKQTQSAYDKGYFVAPNADVNESLSIGKGSGVWYGSKVHGAS